jgi:hypothetical protein
MNGRHTELTTCVLKWTTTFPSKLIFSLRVNP